MRRREFITLLSSEAAAWPLVARAQQPTVPVIGFLRPTKAEQSGHLVAAFRQGLRESGYPGDKVSIEARWADGRAERLPKLAAELVALQVAAIVGQTEATLAAKAATTSIPIVFVIGTDPVAAGLVSSINRPGGNVTGVSFYDVPITGKRLALLRELIPNAEIIAVLQDPKFSGHEAETREIEAAAWVWGCGWLSETEPFGHFAWYIRLRIPRDAWPKTIRTPKRIKRSVRISAHSPLWSTSLESASKLSFTCRITSPLTL